MVVKCSQTTHQKETVKLIKDFFNLADYNFPRATEWGNGIISRLFGVTGIKFNKPFMAEVFEGSFTTSSLLEKYPISKSQVMYTFTIREQTNYRGETYYKVRATRVYHSGKVFIDGHKGSEKYFDFKKAPIHYYLGDYDTSIQQAIKTLVLVADKENVVEKEHRISVPKKEDELIQHIVNGYNDYKTHRVKWIEREDNTDWVALREGSGKKYKYKKSDYCVHFDNSGYCDVSFRESIISKLSGYSTYLKLKRLAETDYSQELQTRYNEIMVLKNLIATSIINTTNSETFRILYDLMGETVSDVQRHERIIRKLKESREIYEEYNHEPFNFRTCGCYSTVDVITKDFEHLDSSILYIRTKLLDNILQQDI